MPEIRARRSITAFAERPVEEERLWAILEAARLAPSAKNKQPWRFVVIRDRVIKERVSSTFLPLHGWAKRAPVLIALVSRAGDDISHEGKDYYLYDCGLAAMSLALEAEHQGLKTHQFISFNEGRLKEVLGIPADYDVLVLIAVGYEAEDVGLTAKAAAGLRAKIVRSRVRKELNKIAFCDGWERQT
ncbi:MAG: nitroreductase family protein [Candidatus Bipolaricaulia bacterium]